MHIIVALDAKNCLTMHGGSLDITLYPHIIQTETAVWYLTPKIQHTIYGCSVDGNNFWSRYLMNSSGRFTVRVMQGLDARLCIFWFIVAIAAEWVLGSLQHWAKTQVVQMYCYTQWPHQQSKAPYVYASSLLTAMMILIHHMSCRRSPRIQRQLWCRKCPQAWESKLAGISKLVL